MYSSPQQRDPRVLDPEPFRVRFDVGQESPVGVDRSSREPVGAAGDGEMGEAGAVLDAGEQQRLAVEAGLTPGLKTAFTVYGQSAAVRIGFPS